MGSVVEPDETLASAPDDRTRLIAAAFEQLRGELREMELRLRKEIEQLRSDIMTAIERSRNSLLIWFIALMFAQAGALAVLLKLL